MPQFSYHMRGDCLELMKQIPDSYVDLILCDLPYGTTGNVWDSIIPLDRLWEQYWRLCKGAIVLTAAQPFTSVLVCSALKQFKYDWTWRKEKGTGHLNAKRMPMRDKEDIVVFGQNKLIYNPQFEIGKPYDGNSRVGKKQQTSSYGVYEAVREDNNGKRYPKQVIEFQTVGQGGIHPTQKPVALMEYLIKTYTNEGMTVLDNCMGSGTTGVACANTGRNFIGIEKNNVYFASADKRINEARAALAVVAAE